MKFIKAIKHYLYYLGLLKYKSSEAQQSIQYPADSDAKEEHLRYLKELVSLEAERQNAIENKTSQLISQCGLIFSLLGLFVPIYFDKFIDFSMFIKVVLLTPFLLAFFFYILTIIKSIENYNISRYGYVTGSVRTVCKKKTKEEFILEEINDLIYAVTKNTRLNNIKGSNLLHAFRAFRLANICIAIMGAFIGYLMLFYTKEPNASIQLNKKIELIDSRMNLLDSNLYMLRKQFTNNSHIIHDTSKKMRN